MQRGMKAQSLFLLVFVSCLLINDEHCLIGIIKDNTRGYKSCSNETSIDLRAAEEPGDELAAAEPESLGLQSGRLQRTQSAVISPSFCQLWYRVLAIQCQEFEVVLNGHS